MKKRKTGPAIWLAAMISGILSGVLFAVEGICAFTRGVMPIYRTVWGGECGTDVGIGWDIFTVYPMSSVDEPIASSSSVSFNPNIFAFFALVWVAAFVVIKIAARKKAACAVQDDGGNTV